jgi:hypothetical protein
MSEQKQRKVEETVENAKRTITEELEVAGGQVVERVQDLVKQGNVRRIIIRTADDKVLLETSLTIGAVAGGLLALTPLGLPLAVLGAIAAVASKVKIEIIREVSDETETIVETKTTKKKIDIEKE